jgi:hypothetical protein
MIAEAARRCNAERSRGGSMDWGQIYESVPDTRARFRTWRRSATMVVDIHVGEDR